VKKVRYKFSAASVDYYFAGGLSLMKKVVDPRHAVVITDENVFGHHEKRFKGWNTMVLKAGEVHKVQATVDSVIEQLIDIEADRSTTLIGVGGGVITDLVGYIASIYMRGVPFGFVPTTLLGMVDASIGGKNGIDVDVYKNMVGVIRQPSFILHDLVFLNTLPQNEWENGFAEIIKHACIRDAAMFKELEAGSFRTYQSKQKDVCKLIERNAVIKTRIVQRDEFEKGERRLLNFGHTLGHALENLYELSHGQAVSIGMTYAAVISEQLTGFREANRVAKLLLKYDLPTFTDFNTKEVFEVLKMDKKRIRSDINYIMLDKIGKGVIKSIPLKKLENIISSLQ
jgi:3-dehydroquinate synthase